MMQLEVGKYYMTRDGKKLGPMWYQAYLGGFVCDASGKLYCPDGTHGDAIDVNNTSIENRPEDDIIAEWQDESTAMTAIEHLRKAYELFLADGKDKAARDVLGVVLDHE